MTQAKATIEILWLSVLSGDWERVHSSGNMGLPLFLLEQYAVNCTTNLLKWPLHEDFFFFLAVKSLLETQVWHLPSLWVSKAKRRDFRKLRGTWHMKDRIRYWFLNLENHKETPIIWITQITKSRGGYYFSQRMGTGSAVGRPRSMFIGFLCQSKKTLVQTDHTKLWVYAALRLHILFQPKCLASTKHTLNIHLMKEESYICI